MVYVWLPGHGFVFPVMAPVGSGAAVCMFTVVELEVLPQLLLAVTDTVYGPPGVVQSMVTEVVPCPAVIVPPADTVHA
jgi:hypothetical protein